MHTHTHTHTHLYKHTNIHIPSGALIDRSLYSLRLHTYVHTCQVRRTFHSKTEWTDSNRLKQSACHSSYKHPFYLTPFSLSLPLPLQAPLMSVKQSCRPSPDTNWTHPPASTTTSGSTPTSRPWRGRRREGGARSHPEHPQLRCVCTYTCHGARQCIKQTYILYVPGCR